VWPLALQTSGSVFLNLGSQHKELHPTSESYSSLTELQLFKYARTRRRSPHRDGAAPDIFRRTPAAAAEGLWVVLIASVTADAGRVHCGQRPRHPKLEASKPRGKMMNIHFEVAGAGATSGAWARTDAAAARSARRPAEEGLWPAEVEAFGLAALLRAAVRRARACDRRFGLTGGRAGQPARPAARAAYLARVRRAHAR